MTTVEINAPGADAFDAWLYTVNSSGFPQTRVASLTRPTSYLAAIKTFVAPARTVLEPNTTYTLVIARPGLQSLFLRVITDDNEYGEDGWSIADTRTDWIGSAWTHNTSGKSVRIAIEGETYNSPAPRNVSANAGNGRAILGWDRPSGIKSYDGFLGRYEYQQKTGTGTWGDWKYASDQWVTGLVVTGLTNGTEYSFRVRAVYQSGSYLSVHTIGAESEIASTTHV